MWRPILFMDSMVRAILDGRKTVTRRVGPTWAAVQPGTRLWVREAHKVWTRTYCDEGEGEDVDESDAAESSVGEYVNFRATPRVGMRRWTWPPRPPDAFQGRPHRITFLHPSTPATADPDLFEGPWRPSIHMPRWASRLTLEVVSVTEEPGQELWPGLDGDGPWEQPVPRVDDDEARREGFASRAEFLAAWRSMHADHTGPVYRIEFRRVDQ